MGLMMLLRLEFPLKGLALFQGRIVVRICTQEPCFSVSFCLMKLKLCVIGKYVESICHNFAVLERKKNSLLIRSCGLAAFEFRPQSKGILVTHLEKLLPQPISIEEVFGKVKEGKTAKLQFQLEYFLQQSETSTSVIFLSYCCDLEHKLFFGTAIFWNVLPRRVSTQILAAENEGNISDCFLPGYYRQSGSSEPKVNFSHFLIYCGLCQKNAGEMLLYTCIYANLCECAEIIV